VRIEPAGVWFLSDASAASKDPNAAMMHVDRMTGELTARDGASRIIEATCHLAPFTPLPKNLF
jgi:hypothetical protein